MTVSTPIPAEQAAKDLRDALAYMREHGRCRGKEIDNDGRVCATGALNTVIFGQPLGMHHVDYEPNAFLSARSYAACSALRKVIPVEGEYRIFEYNDELADDREVFAWFEDAIALAERRVAS